ncbi:MAG: AAA family ATPase [candidate division Zixibacteria bacterium]|nr:AAA family ATPase [candidate division Zixibacteria bacterium]
MFVERITIENWRNFRSANAFLRRRMFLVGPNASGKSNFLDVFRFLRDIAKPGGGLQESIKERGGLSKIRCLAARRNPRVEISVTLRNGDTDNSTTYTYAIGIAQETRGHRRPILAYEKVLRGGVPILERPNEQDTEDAELLTQTHLEQINANRKFRDIATYFQSISYQHLVPQLLRHPEDFTGPVARDDPFGRNFLEKVALTPEKTKEARLVKIERVLKAVVPQLGQLKPFKDSRGFPHLVATYEHWRSQGAKQGEEEFSDGTLRLIGLLWALLEGDSLLLLEEPELSLHACIVRRLPSLIWRIQEREKRQVIISTHSAEFLSDKGIGGEEILMLIPSAEGTKVELAASRADVKALLEQGLTAADVVLPRTGPGSISQLALDLRE